MRSFSSTTSRTASATRLLPHQSNSTTTLSRLFAEWKTQCLASPSTNASFSTVEISLFADTPSRQRLIKHTWSTTCISKVMESSQGRLYMTCSSTRTLDSRRCLDLSCTTGECRLSSQLSRRKLRLKRNYNRARRHFR